ncbi:unnamed protein product, partial [Ectocarpus fasciculatus]
MPTDRSTRPKPAAASGGISSVSVTASPPSPASLTPPDFATGFCPPMKQMEGSHASQGGESSHGGTGSGGS